jgi:hypothetical protein
MMRSELAIATAARGWAASRPSRRARRVARGLGLACGLVAVAVALQSWTVASTGAALGTDLGVVAIAPGELELTTSGPVLQTSAMQPGDAAVRGTLALRNITAAPVRVRVRALPSTPVLDDALALRMIVRGRPFARGSAGALRDWSARHITIGVRQTASITVQAWLRRPAQGLIGDITLEFDADPVTRR